MTHADLDTLEALLARLGPHLARVTDGLDAPVTPRPGYRYPSLQDLRAGLYGQLTAASAATRADGRRTLDTL